jgi:hypothetical protein
VVHQSLDARQVDALPHQLNAVGRPPLVQPDGGRVRSRAPGNRGRRGNRGGFVPPAFPTNGSRRGPGRRGEGTPLRRARVYAGDTATGGKANGSGLPRRDFPRPNTECQWRRRPMQAADFAPCPFKSGPCGKKKKPPMVGGTLRHGGWPNPPCRATSILSY